jgi:hypothetical protein
MSKEAYELSAAFLQNRQYSSCDEQLLKKMLLLRSIPEYAQM